MKILMLNYEFPPLGGGGGQAHLNLLKEYAQRPELSIDVLTASSSKQFVNEQLSDNIRLHRIGLHKKDIHYWRKSEVIEWLMKANSYYNRLVRDNQYDLIHAFFAFPSGALCLKTAGRIPYIISLRGSDVPGFNNRLKLDYYLLKGLFRKIWNNAHAVVANSQGLATLASAFTPSLEIGVICNGINTRVFTPPAHRCLDGRIRLLTVCRLIERKRIHLLIQAVSHLTRQGIDAELNIVGEGILLDELKQLAAELNIAERIHFMGLIEYKNLPPVYQQNHLFLMSSLHEGMSNAMLEALACGLPVVTTPCEGTEELVSKNGMIITESEPEFFAKAITEITRDPSQYNQMSNKSRDIAEKFSWKITADRYIKLYQSLQS